MRGVAPAALFAAAWLAFNAEPPRLSPPVAATPLAGETQHVQGIEVDERRLWVTSVDKEKKAGLLFEYTLPEAAIKRSVEVQDGVRYHPGGISGDAETLWIPIAEYHRAGTSVVQRRSKRTLGIQSQFPVGDHIGCIAVTPTHVVGANWDARLIYIWTHDGRPVRTVRNPTNNAFQDMKFVDGQIVAAGLLPDKSGAIDWLEYPSLKPTRRVLAGRTDRGVAYTHEGMALSGELLYLLPEDSPSRLFTFRLKPRSPE